MVFCWDCLHCGFKHRISRECLRGAPPFSTGFTNFFSVSQPARRIYENQSSNLRVTGHSQGELSEIVQYYFMDFHPALSTRRLRAGLVMGEGGIGIGSERYGALSSGKLYCMSILFKFRRSFCANSLIPPCSSQRKSTEGRTEYCPHRYVFSLRSIETTTV